MPTGIDVPAHPIVAANATVVAHAGSGSLTVADAGKNHTNTGSSGTVVLTLPAVAAFAGCSIRVQVTAAQIVRCTPASGESVYLGGSGVASKYLNIAAVVGNYCDLHCDGEQWKVLGYSGVVTKES